VTHKDNSAYDNFNSVTNQKDNSAVNWKLRGPPAVKALSVDLPRMLVTLQIAARNKPNGNNDAPGPAGMGTSTKSSRQSGLSIIVCGMKIDRAAA